MRTFAFLFLAACSSSSGDAADGGASSDVAPEAGPPACSSDLATSDQSCGSLAWSTSGTSSRLRNHHITIITHAQDGSAHIVVIAGVNGASAMNNVDIAPIAADGTVGTFTASFQYQPLGGLTGANVNEVVVAAGGKGGNSYSDAVFSAVVQSDGTLADWQKQPVLNEPRMHAASFAVGTRMWVLGGFADSVYDDIVYADVAADGTIASWNPGGTLPGPLTHFSVAYAHGFIYASGGLDQLPTLNPDEHKDVLRGTVEPDGTIDSWMKLTPLPVGICTHSSFVYGGYLYVAGGIDGSPAQLADVRRAAFQPDGTIGDWETVAQLPLARGHVHQTPVDGNHVFSVSGAIDFSLDSTPDIFVGTFQ